MNFAQLKKYIRKARRVYVDAILTNEDPISVQVMKNDLMLTIKHDLEPQYKSLVKRGEARIEGNWVEGNFYFYGIFE